MADTLDTCGCCEGVHRETPAPLVNRPGLSALSYRVGTHGRFTASMQAALSARPELARLTVRGTDDPTMAVVDAWATVLDVLTFYQERIANEGFLRTATERRSVLELARRIGYELRPGVAASTTLAFTLETGPGTPGRATIPEGTRAQSLPGQDETPQVFETTGAIEARAGWQELTARQTRPFQPVRGTVGLWLEGVDNDLRAGDVVLLVGPERADDAASDRWDVRILESVDLDRIRGVTYIRFEYPLGSWAPPQLPSDDPTVYVLRRRASLFGHNAPDWDAMPDEVRDRYDSSSTSPSTLPEWPGLTIRDISGIEDRDFAGGPIHLDALYPEILRDGWVVLSRPGYSEVYRVGAVEEAARSRFTLSSKTTRLELDGENLSDRFDEHVRETLVFAESQALVRAERPLEDPVEGGSVVLSQAVEGLEEGRMVALRGIDADTGEPAAEVATLADVREVDGLTELVFVDPLEYRYLRRDGDAGTGVRINANVAPATHGKTAPAEVLGSGDGSERFQRFSLAQTPLTHVSAATPSGTESTLEVRVDDVRWTEVPSLYRQPPGARVYVTRRADGGDTTVLFGDGTSGARLPTGQENVTANYRHGIGLDALVDADQISLLMTRPLGVKGVTNPTAPNGAADPERLAEARTNAPLTVLTLDRIVSVQDFEDFAAAFAGIGKARAGVLWSGERRLVHLTVAGSDGGAVPEDSELHGNLRSAIDAARHPDQEVVVASFHPVHFTLEARLTVHPDHLEEVVRAAVESVLLEAFSFDARAFAQDITTSEVLAAMQKVAGVVGVDLDLLDGADPFDAPRIQARPARWESGAIQPAELLTLDAAGLILTTERP